MCRGLVAGPQNLAACFEAATIDSYACNARLLFPNLYAQAALHAALQLTLASAIPLIMPCYVKQQSHQISMACGGLLQRGGA